MIEIEYVREEDRAEYRSFFTHHLPSFTRAAPAEIWHYTNAEGLIGILTSGQVFATQISCLNDNLELRYFGDLIHEEVKRRLAKDCDPQIRVMLRAADHALTNRDISATGQFVCCFSDIEDDLNQWRGYGGGECGYAIGFKPDLLIEVLKSRPGSYLVPMNYDADRHQFMVEEVVKWAEKFFMNGVKRGLPDFEKWASEFIREYGTIGEIFASIIKHPKFIGETERRIATLLQVGESAKLQFRQKRTLLARHLPLDLTHRVSDQKLLPISRIFVGPGPAQQVSKISVGDLLAQCRYTNITVELSKVPYRVP